MLVCCLTCIIWILLHLCLTPCQVVHCPESPSLCTVGYPSYLVYMIDLPELLVFRRLILCQEVCFLSVSRPSVLRFRLSAAHVSQVPPFLTEVTYQVFEFALCSLVFPSIAVTVHSLLTLCGCSFLLLYSLHCRWWSSRSRLHLFRFLCSSLAHPCQNSSFVVCEFFNSQELLAEFLVPHTEHESISHCLW